MSNVPTYGSPESAPTLQLHRDQFVHLTIANHSLYVGMDGQNNYIIIPQSKENLPPNFFEELIKILQAAKKE